MNRVALTLQYAATKKYDAKGLNSLRSAEQPRNVGKTSGCNSTTGFFLYLFFSTGSLLQSIACVYVNNFAEGSSSDQMITKLTRTYLTLPCPHSQMRRFKLNAGFFFFKQRCKSNDSKFFLIYKVDFYHINFYVWTEYFSE